MCVEYLNTGHFESQEGPSWDTDAEIRDVPENMAVGNPNHVVSVA